RVNLSGCANWLLLKDYYTVGQTRLSKTNTCKQHLLCPFCASRRAAKLVQKNMPKVEKLLEENRSLVPVMVTLTIKNRDDLGEAFEHLTKSFRRLTDRRRDKLKKGWGKTEFAKVDGAYFSFEFTHSDNGYHPHIHMVGLLNDYIDVEALSAEWHEITGDSFIVDVRKIRGYKGEMGSMGSMDTSGECIQNSQLFEGLAEVFKYALKFQDLETDQVWHAWETLKGKRLIGSFGSLWGLKMPESLLDEDLKDLPFIEKFYTYSKGAQKYSLRTYAHVSEHGELIGSGTGADEREHVPTAFQYDSMANGPTEGSHREKPKVELARSNDARGPALLAGMDNKHPATSKPPRVIAPPG
ncbi:MAG: protein rep, partial [Sphaerochaetaceae bacterium]